MTVINEEYIAELARALGDEYVAIKNGVGDVNTPGTALFEIQQLRDFATRSLPHFGVLATTPQGFLVTPNPADARTLNLSGGQVGFQGQRLTVPPQRIIASRLFAPIYGANSTYVYGLRVGFPLSEARRATQIFATTLSSAANAGDQTVQVTDLAMVQSLGFPVQAYLGTTFVSFSGLSSAGDALQIDPSFNGGVLAESHQVGEPVNLKYQPRAQAVCGLPVSTSFQSSSVSDFAYFPPLPQDWLPLADVLMVNPTSPTLLTFSNSTPAIMRTAYDWPSAANGSPNLSTAAATMVQRAADQQATRTRALVSEGSISDAVRALESYTAAVSDAPSTSFRAFWAQRPFRASSHFGIGVSFDSLERLEFSDSFARAYFDIMSVDLQHTFALFRGDLYTATSLSAGATPQGVSASSVPALSVPSTLTRGTYVYGVSAVRSAGETAPVYSTARTGAAPGFYVSEIAFAADPSHPALFYHIYRRSTQVGDQAEYRITQNSQVTGSGVFTPLALTPVQDLTLGSTSQFRVTASGGSQLGGLEFQLRVTAAQTSGSLSVSLYADASGSPGTLIASGSSVPYASLGTAYQSALSQVDAALTLGGTYWVVLTQSATPSGGTLAIHTDGGGRPWYKLHAFLDGGRPGVSLTRRGVRLTGRTALTPRGLSVYVPPMDPTGVSDVPYVGMTSGAASPETPETKNDMVVTVTARLGEGGLPTTLSATVPQGTVRGTRILLGFPTQLFDRVDDVQVTPGANLRIGAGGYIQWSVYDFLSVETTP